jgi:DNA polymerase (family 10)
MSEAAMTARVSRALRHARVNVFAHPTGRLLGKREPYAIDMVQIVRLAKAQGVLLEINAQPERLDLSDTLVRMARDAGARLVIDTDAHRTSELDVMRYGVDQARRGWCTAEDVANTRPLDELRALLGREAPARSARVARARRAG